jgi:Mg-chelatase subunit ChlD
VGELDEAAVDDLLRDDPDALLSMLADLVGATDRRLRELAMRLAGRLFLDLARRGPVRRSGAGRLVTQRYSPDGGDLDVDASLEALAERVGGSVDVDRLRVTAWSRPATALCLVVDRSGSMGGAPLATAALAAAAVASRAPEDHSVLAFGSTVLVLKGQRVPKPAGAVVTDLLSLRGHGTTDVAAALHGAALQLSGSRAGRRVTVLLSDCRSTAGGDALEAAGLLDELVVVAPAADAEEARAFCRRAGARLTTVGGPSDVAEALTRALDRGA